MFYYSIEYSLTVVMCDRENLGFTRKLVFYINWNLPTFVDVKLVFKYSLQNERTCILS